MLTKRIIPCLDIKDGQTVKGVQFENLVIAGDPVELAARYAQEGADELCFLDITATLEKRKTLKELVNQIASHINIPFTVGGGIQSIQDIEVLLQAGADKVTINSAAVQNPQLVTEAAYQFGSQCMVVAIDAKNIEGNWLVHTHGGKKPTSLSLFEWAKEMQERGAGEILFTSMNNDGQKKGFAIDALQQITEMLTIPVIASGGAGSQEDFGHLFSHTQADAGLAASIFHFNEINISSLKQYLYELGIPVRLS
ncbi:MAG: imidazole glycerol phosphate synthase subunit HisF [Cytophagales bacterium]|nr:MAG: imidazole glycerol phosphate synthase subunit HisF [Cytophagales bacterium]